MQAPLDGTCLPIVLLPGMDGTGAFLQELAILLRRRRPVHVIKYPEQEALDYAALIDLVRKQLPTDPFVILGESFSGPIAIELAATMPRIAGLILASSFARRPVPAFTAPLTRLFDPRQVPQWIVNAALFGPTGTHDQRTQLHRVLAGLGQGVLQTRMADVAAVEKLARLSKVTCPVLCLCGNRDRLIPNRCLDEIRRAQPHVQVQHLDAAHMMLCTHSEQAAHPIERFCDAVSKRIIVQHPEPH